MLTNVNNNECDILATTAADGNNLIDDICYMESLKKPMD